ncbi:uncharacterized protein LOC126769530 [Nymphalis io]|uniref:uncharacterized protein LOC126769530 n=1 Tax=Inachis io TaxID=171585 RepID=UPI0021691A48|nr:uncharacterized protein LOC126769530 [Nymphalis io]
MRLEIPECRRCCCCFPLRHGIIVFGYIHLLFSIFVLAVEIYVSINHVSSQHTMALYKGVAFYSQVWFAFILFIAEILFNIVLLVGAHMKKTQLLRAYYYYGITTTLASLVTFIVVRYSDLYSHFGFYILEACFVLTGLGIQVYLLLLVRSELLKIRHTSRLCYVNHAAEIIVDTPIQSGRNPF